MKASRFLKVELRRAGVGYRELAERLNKHGMEEPRPRLPGSWRAGRLLSASSLLASLFWKWKESN